MKCANYQVFFLEKWCNGYFIVIYCNSWPEVLYMLPSGNNM